MVVTRDATTIIGGQGQRGAISGRVDQLRKEIAKATTDYDREKLEERLCRDSDVPAFLLPLRFPAREALRDELMAPRLERAIGVVYRPATELESHYFQAVRPLQFDEYVWFGETSAVRPLDRADVPFAATPQPFGP